MSVAHGERLTDGRPLIQIVPSLPPPAEGLGGAALALAHELLETRAVATRFVVPRGAAGSRDETGEFEVEEVEREAAALASALGSLDRRTESFPLAPAVLVHYANYGYAPRGCPEWLIAGLERFAAAGGRVATIFHEVYASGPPWRSSFWLGPRQRRLAARLARLSDRVATSLDLYAGLLQALEPSLPRAAIALRPVFSNVGDPLAPPPYAARARRLAVFGGAGTRARAWTIFRDEIAAACAGLGLAEVVDIGPFAEGDRAGLREEDLPTSIAGRGGSRVRVRALGPLPAGEVSNLFVTCAAGFLAYPAPFLGKSGTFAAFAAHGLLPIVVGGEAPTPSTPSLPLLPSTPPSAGIHFWDPRTAAPSAATAASIARAAREWYAPHSLAVQAAEIAAWVRGEAEGKG